MHDINLFIIYRHECTPLVKFIRNYIRDSSGALSVYSLVKLSMISLISSLSLKLYLNSLVYERNIFGSSSKTLRQFSEFFGNVWKMLDNVHLALGSILENLRKIVQNASSYMCYIIKRTRYLENMNLMFE